jgi:hypothetical protein
MNADQTDSIESKTPLEDVYEKIDIEELAALELTLEEKQIFEVLDSDLNFQIAVEKVLANIDNVDITQTQSELLLLLYQFFKSKMDNRGYLKTLLKKRKKYIKEDIKKMSLFIMQTKSKIMRDASRNIASAKDRYEYLSKQSRNNLRAIIKRFAVYELYKFVSPRRIAGETRRQNFIHNMLLGGLKYASRYEGGTKAEVASYSPQFLRKLEKDHERINRGGKTNVKGIII